MSLSEHFQKELSYMAKCGCQQLYTPEGALYLSVDLLQREGPIDLGRGPCYTQFAYRVVRFDGIIAGQPHNGTIVTFIGKSYSGIAESSW